MRKTSVAIDVDVSRLLKAIAAKMSKQLGMSVTKGEAMRNIVVHRAREMGLYPRKKDKK